MSRNTDSASLSFLDVLCCAFGGAVLLFLLFVSLNKSGSPDVRSDETVDEAAGDSAPVVVAPSPEETKGAGRPGWVLVDVARDLAERPLLRLENPVPTDGGRPGAKVVDAGAPEIGGMAVWRHAVWLDPGQGGVLTFCLEGKADHAVRVSVTGSNYAGEPQAANVRLNRKFTYDFEGNRLGGY